MMPGARQAQRKGMHDSQFRNYICTCKITYRHNLMKLYESMTKFLSCSHKLYAGKYVLLNMYFD